jgi:hypothetical protein
MVAENEHVEPEPQPEPPDDILEEPISHVRIRQEPRVLPALREMIIGSNHRRF